MKTNIDFDLFQENISKLLDKMNMQKLRFAVCSYKSNEGGIEIKYETTPLNSIICIEENRC